MNHDPESGAASYLFGDMRGRRRARFERHIFECEDCWREVQLGRAGRSVAESGRELAPHEIREQVRAVIAAAPTPARRWRSRWGLRLVALAAVALAGVIYSSLADPAQPPVIAAVLADYRRAAASQERIEAGMPVRLGDSSYERSYTDTLGDLEVVAHSYRDPAGQRLVVYQADRTFPVAAGAEHSRDRRTWTAAADGAVLFCADHPVPSLVVGDEKHDVVFAARELGLR